MKKILTLAIVGVMTLVMSACPNTPYGKAIKVGLDITDSAHTGADTVDKLRLNGSITTDEEKSVLGYLQTVNTIDTTVYGPCVQAAHLAGDKVEGFLACGNSLVNSLSDPALLSSVHVANPKSQQEVQQISQAIINLAQAGVAAFNAAKGK